VTSGTLTVATDSPAYDPWFSNNTPSNGKGFESAVAYAIAKQLGFATNKVKWVVEPFNDSYAPGSKSFDFDVNQISITAARAKAVDFSTGYYTVNQAVIALDSSKYKNVTTIAGLKGARFGVQVGTTSLAAVQNVIKPSASISVYNSTTDAENALKNGQIDVIVADLPTAFYLTSAEIANSRILGQFDYAASGAPEQFGALFQKGNPLVGCVDWAIGQLTSSGELASITDQWLAKAANAPKLS
jgi:polar amino acid transport system substrate-binding protein